MISRVGNIVFTPCKFNLSTGSVVLRRGVFSSSASLTGVYDTDTFGSLKEPLETENRKKGKKNVFPTSDSKLRSVTSTVTSRFPTPKNKNYLSSVNGRDVFGDHVSENDPYHKIETVAERTVPEEEDFLPSERVEHLDIKRKRFIDYAHDIMQLSRQGKLKEAVELFESLSDLGVTYQKKQFLYGVIISACGKRGYTRKAFQIYARMRQHGLRPTPAVLTGLFNSCAECPFPKLGLEKALGLHQKMVEEGWHPTQITYHAMIKAYGRCGDLASAFALVDEMKEKKHALTNETFAFLLQACISDKDAGFSHAIGVMRKMRVLRIKPQVHNYNLLLRAVRDCGVGPPEVASKLLLEWQDGTQLTTHNQKLLQSGKTKQSSSQLHNLAVVPNSHRVKHPSINSEVISTGSTISNKNPTSVKLQEVVFDLLTPSTTKSTILALGEVKTSSDRLALIGGADRVIQKLLNLGENPNIQTATLLLECQVSSAAAENHLLGLMKDAGVRPDIDFFNVLVKKRCTRNDYSGARQVLDLIAEHGLYPDIATFGTLAMTCKNKFHSCSLLKDMERSAFKPNIKVLGSLMKSAFNNMDFSWMQDLMSQLVKHNVSPCEKFLGQLEEAWNDASHALVRMERGKHEVPAWAEREGFREEYKEFCIRYKDWLSSVQVQFPEHPWDQFHPERKSKTIKK